MPFSFEIKELRPEDHGGSPHKALLAEARRFTKERRGYRFRKMGGLERDEEPMPEDMPPAEPPKDGEEADLPEECQKGECEHPEHMKDEDLDEIERLSEE